MKQIINNKIYDTETADMIYEYRHSFSVSNPLLPKGYGFTEWENAYIYKTKKGNYFRYFKYDDDYNYRDRERIEETTIEEVKETISKLNPDEYIKLFGKIDLEEA